MSDQPEALRLADAIEAPDILAGAFRHEVAAELRRQHAEIESAHRAQREAENELSRALARHAMAETALKAERDALRARLSRVADIAHNGGLVESDWLTLFVAIRRLTLSVLDLSGTTDQIKARVHAAIDAAREGK